MGSVDIDCDTKLELDDSGCVQDDFTHNGYGQVSLLDLSDDVLLYILRHCSPRDLKALGFSCTRLGRLVRERSLWRHVDARSESCSQARLKWLLENTLHKDTHLLMVSGYAKETEGCLGLLNMSRQEAAEEKKFYNQQNEARSSNEPNTCGNYYAIVVPTDNGHGSDIFSEQIHEIPIPVHLERHHARFFISAQRTPHLPRFRGFPSWADDTDMGRVGPDACSGPQFSLSQQLLKQLCSNCPQLSTLVLEYCNIDCNRTNLGHFPKTLKKLSLRGTKCYNMAIDKSFLFKIQDYLPMLESLDVSECEWMDPATLLPLSKLATLEELIMRDCHKLAEFVAYASLTARYGFRTLKSLDLRGSPVGDSEVSALGWLPRLERLWLAAGGRVTRAVRHHAHYVDDGRAPHEQLHRWERQVGRAHCSTVTRAVRHHAHYVDDGRAPHEQLHRWERQVGRAHCSTVTRAVRHHAHYVDDGRAPHEQLHRWERQVGRAHCSTVTRAVRHHAHYVDDGRAPHEQLHRWERQVGRAHCSTVTRAVRHHAHYVDDGRAPHEQLHRWERQVGRAHCSTVTRAVRHHAHYVDDGRAPHEQLHRWERQVGRAHCSTVTRAVRHHAHYVDDGRAPHEQLHRWERQVGRAHCSTVTRAVRHHAHYVDDGRAPHEQLHRWERQVGRAHCSTVTRAVRHHAHYVDDGRAPHEQLHRWERQEPDYFKPKANTDSNIEDPERSDPEPSSSIFESYNQIRRSNSNINLPDREKEGSGKRKPEDGSGDSADINGESPVHKRQKTNDNKDDNDNNTCHNNNETANQSNDNANQNNENKNNEEAPKNRIMKIDCEINVNVIGVIETDEDEPEAYPNKENTEKNDEKNKNNENPSKNEEANNERPNQSNEGDKNNPRGDSPDCIVDCIKIDQLIDVGELRCGRQNEVIVIASTSRAKINNPTRQEEGYVHFRRNQEPEETPKVDETKKVDESENEQKSLKRQNENVNDGASTSKDPEKHDQPKEKYVCFRKNQEPVYVNCSPESANQNQGNQRREPLPPIQYQIEPRHHVLYVSVGPQLNTYRFPRDSSEIDRHLNLNFRPTHVDSSSLVTDFAIRRFGRADGEDVNIIHIGPNGPMVVGHDTGSRPDRSNLQFLSVTGYRNITDRSLVHLATAAPNLTRIDFSETSISETGAENFRSLRPDCELTYSKYTEKKE
ncbi:unnamed protein product [Euphydryas editha]|uniref:F-box domain-containing protein n=1 Tax=Euphydryas editha TaxID=104508 RepID=A0AAU9TBI5_EUPED|nr:unnamed protein product [Euphydryas editha]